MTEPLTLGWLLTILLGVLAFVGALGVKALMQMSKDLTEIKTEVKVLVSKHDEHDRRIERMEKILEEDL